MHENNVRSHNRTAFLSLNVTIQDVVCHGLNTVNFKLTDAIAATAVFAIVTNTIMSLVSVIGNGLVVYVIAVSKELRSNFNGMLQISFLSLLYSSIPQALLTAIRYHDLINYHNCPLKLCATLLAYLIQIVLYTSISAVAIDRCIAIVLPRLYESIKVYYIYIGVFAGTTTIFLPIIILGYTRSISVRIFNWLVSSLLLLCMLIITLCYTKIHIVLAKHQRVRALDMNGGLSEGERAIQLHIERRRNQTILMIIGFHFVCMLSKSLCIVARNVSENDFLVVYKCHRFTGFLFSLNGAGYPFLYAWRISVLQNELIRVLKKIFQCKGTSVASSQLPQYP